MLLKHRKILSFILAISLAVFIFVESAPTVNAETTATPTPPTETPSTETTSAQAGTVNTPDTNLRAQPSTVSEVLVKLSEGAAVSVLEGSAHGWCKVMYQSYTGYVKSDFIDMMVTGLSDPGVIIAEAAMTGQPEAGSAVVSTLAVETQVTVTGSYGSYYQVQAATLTGFVPQECVHKNKIITLNMSATINASNVNLRSIPSTSGDIVVCMKGGVKVTVYSIQDHWVKIDYEGKAGYVRGDFVTYKLSGDDYVTSMNLGMRGQAVSTLQVALRKKGFFHVAANGVYGKATRAAVKKFQESVYLDADGIAGEQTLLLLFGKDAPKIWHNFRSEMEAQKPLQNGRVWLTDWFDGMNKIMERMTPFEVIDVRTGIHWNMQRFGGYSALWHADVETVTKDDTKKMTEAWGGELNPTRRPVWVKYDGKYYAASLMGFVHNTGPTSTNGMDGQVCLHFRGSKIHSSGHIDEAHQACIMEAYYSADKLDAYISSGKV
jgi:uncharacterized protein YgiM (DUF1202 family)